MCFSWFKKREKIKLYVCSVSGLLPGDDCVETEEREYYKEPKPGDPYQWPTKVCDVCQPEPDDLPDPPDPEKIKVTVCTDKPTAGIFDVGCVIDFESTASGYRGCICTVAGEPGTWVYFGAVV